MPNRFLERLGGDASVAALKRLWRAASRRAHPDLGGADATFVALRTEYEEALAFLEAGIEPAGTAARGGGGDNGRPGRAPGSQAAAVRRGPATAAETGPRRARAPAPSAPSPGLAAYRAAIARFGEAARAAGCDPYRWKPDDALALGLVAAARAFDPGAGAVLSRLLGAIADSDRSWHRYPGLMNRWFAFYDACARFAAWSGSGWESDLAACRTRLADLADPTAALFDSRRLADVPGRFSAAAAALGKALPEA